MLRLLLIYWWRANPPCSKSKSIHHYAFTYQIPIDINPSHGECTYVLFHSIYISDLPWNRWLVGPPFVWVMNNIGVSQACFWRGLFAENFDYPFFSIPCLTYISNGWQAKAFRQRKWGLELHRIKVWLKRLWIFIIIFYTWCIKLMY